MDKNKNCSACNIKLDKDKYKEDRTVCKNFYNRKKRKNSNNTSHHNQEPKVLITMTRTIKPQTLDEILEPRNPRSPRTKKS